MEAVSSMQTELGADNGFAFCLAQDKVDSETGVGTFQGADPAELPGRKLAAEACIVDLLAPMVAESYPIPEHLDMMARAGWCGWNAGIADAGHSSVTPDERSVGRYARGIRELTAKSLEPLLRRLIYRLFWDRHGARTELPLNATLVRRILATQVPWTHREMINEILDELTATGYLSATTRGYRLAPLACCKTPAVSTDTSLCEMFIDLYPALTGYIDMQPAAMVGRGEFVVDEALSDVRDTLFTGFDQVMVPFVRAASVAPPERRLLFQIHALGTMVESPVAGDISDASVSNEELRLIGPYLGAKVFPGWGNPAEALSGLRGALGNLFFQQSKDKPGGLYRSVHRSCGLGSGTLAAYLDEPLLINRHSGKIRSAHHDELSRVAFESRWLLFQEFPESKSERWLWDRVSKFSESLTFHDYRGLLVKWARDGYLALSRSGSVRSFVALHSRSISSASLSWERWRRLWRWLPALRAVARSVWKRSPESFIRKWQWIVDRHDLPRIEEQIQSMPHSTFNSDRKKSEYPNAVDSAQCKKSRILIFSRQEPWLLTFMEDF